MRIHALIKRSLTTHCLHFVASTAAKIGSRWIPVLIPVYRYWFFPIPKYRYWEIGPVLQALLFSLVCGTPPCLNRHHRNNDDCLEGKREIIGCVLCSIVCNNYAECDAHTHTNKPNSSLDWVLYHWAHSTVLRFIFICIMCIIVCCMHDIV